MRFIANLITSLLIAGSIATMSVFSIQNITPVSLKFIQFESIQIPIGVLLSICVGSGFIMGAFVPPLLSSPKNSSRRRLEEINVDDFEEFNFDR
jgi:lipopolysaccharide assembly protein A